MRLAFVGFERAYSDVTLLEHDKVMPVGLPTRMLDTFSPPLNGYLAIDEKGRRDAVWLIRRS